MDESMVDLTQFLPKDRKPRFLIDVDEVLADFQTPVLQIIHELTGEPLKKPSDFNQWDILVDLPSEVRDRLFQVIEAPGFCANLTVRAGAKDFIDKLRTHVDVYAVTSPWHGANWMWERTQWLISHLGFDKKHIVQTSAKYLCKGEFFLDDNPDHVTSWKKEFPLGVGMLYNIPNTQSLVVPNVLRVHRWTEVLQWVTWSG